MRNTIATGLRMMLILNVPATIGLIALATPIVEFLLQYRAFTPHDTASTAAALMFYAPGLVGYSAVKIASPSFYALGESRTPVLVGMSSVCLNFILNLMLVQVMGYRGLALGTAIAALFNASLLLALLQRRLGGLDARAIAIVFAKICVASMLMGAAAHYTEAWFAGVLPGDAWYVRAVRVSGAIGVGIAVLLASARLLGVAELSVAINRVVRRIARR
jgi:putative peptidoglycan lipid II flippase